ncbi:caspase domain-containing protein [Kitasatospora sp. DSM 101779]|uniref:caspase family protein n=1 Tax=Kitasatospora sp. DSM 101779 TaxID=2853165 RepID=UPI0021DA6DD2|nr:caspase family protein [Kitasatospora sp. DSM 101779]MCU7822185.1 caspase family protein [Kitasatospora sp. DSM 101779]
MRELSDPLASGAVLIGVHNYAHLEDLPAVERSVTRLTRNLRDGRIWGLPVERCTELLQPSRDQIFDALHSAVDEATDTLLFYFLGHGLTHDTTGELYLALQDSSASRLDRAVRYEDLRSLVLRRGSGGNARAKRRVVILDCCWSGLALDGGMSAQKVGNSTNIAGTFVLTATAETRKAISPPGEIYTAFTGALIDILENGIPGEPALLTMSSVYDQLCESLGARSFPEPQQRNRNNSGGICIFKNVGCRSIAPEGRRAAVELTAENDQTTMLRSGASFTSRPDLLRDGGKVFTGTLDVFEGPDVKPAQPERRGDGHLHPSPEEVADFITVIESKSAENIVSYIRLLFGLGRTAEYTQVADGAGRYQSVSSIIEIIAALGLSDSHQAVKQVIISFSRVRPIPEIIDLVIGLREVDRGNDAVRVLIGAASLRPASDVLDLILACAKAGNRTDAARVIKAVGLWASSKETIAIIHSLRATGNSGSAHDILQTAGRSDAPGRVRELLQDLRKAGRVADMVVVMDSAAAGLSTDPQIEEALKKAAELAEEREAWEARSKRVD